MVLTQPDRPVGRGLRVAPSAVKRAAATLNLRIEQPPTVRSGEADALLRGVDPQALIVAAYGLILPQSMLEIPPLGAINIHASLLPRWRGAAPIQRALLAGDAQTGISIMRMDAGLDTGPVFARRAIDILPEDDAGTLHDRLADLGAQLVAEVLEALPSLQAEPQPVDGVTYAAKITKEDTVIDWRRPADELARMIRAFRPAPGAATHLNGALIKIWRAHEIDATGAPGTLMPGSSDELIVGCGARALAITELQRSGGRRLSASEFARGHRLAPGVRFG